jgi:hypothetical protein
MDPIPTTKPGTVTKKDLYIGKTQKGAYIHSALSWHYSPHVNDAPDQQVDILEFHLCENRSHRRLSDRFAQAQVKSQLAHVRLERSSIIHARAAVSNGLL